MLIRFRGHRDEDLLPADIDAGRVRLQDRPILQTHSFLVFFSGFP
jgi:hypothetical protein